VCEADCRAIYN